MKTLHELIRESPPISVHELNGTSGHHKPARKSIGWFKVAILALVSAYVLPLTVHEWLLVNATLHKQGLLWFWEPKPKYLFRQ